MAEPEQETNVENLLRHYAAGEREFNRANLRDAKLSSANLRHAILSGADLSGADLSDADLSGVTFNCADLNGGNLRRAHLSDAKLSGAEFRNACLSGAELCRVDLRHAKLSNADLAGADLSAADLAGADLAGADLSGANLNGANLNGANLRHAQLSGAKLISANLGGADLGGADLRGATLFAANLNNANLRRAKLVKADLRDANLSNAKFFRTILRGVDVSSAKLSDADFLGLIFGADLRSAIRFGVSHRAIRRLVRGFGAIRRVGSRFGGIPRDSVRKEDMLQTEPMNWIDGVSALKAAYNLEDPAACNVALRDLTIEAVQSPDKVRVNRSLLILLDRVGDTAHTESTAADLWLTGGVGFGALVGAGGPIIGAVLDAIKWGAFWVSIVGSVALVLGILTIFLAVRIARQRSQWKAVKAKADRLSEILVNIATMSAQQPNQASNATVADTSDPVSGAKLRIQSEAQQRIKLSSAPPNPASSADWGESQHDEELMSDATRKLGEP
ncbi:MAG: pentapeptide repeat-containing protein [Polyangiaceae bacterium]